MTPLPDIITARDAFRDYAENAPATVEADTLADMKAIAANISPVVVIAEGAELLFARADEFDKAGKLLGAQLAAFAAGNGYHELHVAERGEKMALALRRERGDKFAAGDRKPQKKADDPAPSPRMKRREAEADDTPSNPVGPAQ
jgi:hypothetical protein